MSNGTVGEEIYKRMKDTIDFLNELWCASPEGKAAGF
jgi:hypothetical protein